MRGAQRAPFQQFQRFGELPQQPALYVRQPFPVVNHRTGYGFSQGFEGAGAGQAPSQQNHAPPDSPVHHVTLAVDENDLLLIDDGLELHAPDRDECAVSRRPPQGLAAQVVEADRNRRHPPMVHRGSKKSLLAPAAQEFFPPSRPACASKFNSRRRAPSAAPAFIDECPEFRRLPGIIHAILRASPRPRAGCHWTPAAADSTLVCLNSGSVLSAG